MSTADYRLAWIMALTGVAVASCLSFRLPPRYSASAELRVSSVYSDSPGYSFLEASMLAGNATGRVALANLILSPDLRLYDEERTTQPIEKVIARMKSNDLQVVAGPDGTLRISFEGRSPAEAAQAVRYMVTRLNAEHDRMQAALALLPVEDPRRDQALRRFTSSLKTIYAPQLPARSSSPSGLEFALAGALLGVAFAGLLTLIRTAPRVWLAVSLGAALLAAATWLLPLPYEATATLAFDSSATRSAVTANPGRLSAEIRNNALILGGQPRDFYGFDLYSEATPGVLTIRTRHVDPQIAFSLAQFAFVRLLDEVRSRGGVRRREIFLVDGPGLEMLDPPVVPVTPMGRRACELILLTSSVACLLAGAVILFDKLRSQLTVQLA